MRVVTNGYRLQRCTTSNSAVWRSSRTTRIRVYDELQQYWQQTLFAWKKQFPASALKMLQTRPAKFFDIHLLLLCINVCLSVCGTFVLSLQMPVTFTAKIPFICIVSMGRHVWRGLSLISAHICRESGHLLVITVDILFIWSRFSTVH